MAVRPSRLTEADLFEHEDLRRFFAAAGAGQPADIISMVRTARERANRNTIVHLKNGARFVLRQYDADFVPVRTPESIAYEHAVLGRLAGARLPLPKP